MPLIWPMWQKFDMEKMIPSLNLQFSSQDPVMEGSSAMSPLGEPSIPMIAACAPALSCVRIAPWNRSTVFKIKDVCM